MSGHTALLVFASLFTLVTAVGLAFGEDVSTAAIIAHTYIAASFLAKKR